MPEGALMPAANTGIVTPLLIMTGNPFFYDRAPSELDFNAGPIITEGETIGSAGKRLLDLIRQIASGRLTKAETMGTNEPVELYMRNTVF